MLEEINELGQIVFESEPHLKSRFYYHLKREEFNKAKVITYAMQVISPDSNDAIKLNNLIEKLII